MKQRDIPVAFWPLLATLVMEVGAVIWLWAPLWLKLVLLVEIPAALIVCVAAAPLRRNPLADPAARWWTKA